MPTVANFLLTKESKPMVKIEWNQIDRETCLFRMGGNEKFVGCGVVEPEVVTRRDQDVHGRSTTTDHVINHDHYSVMSQYFNTACHSTTMNRSIQSIHRSLHPSIHSFINPSIISKKIATKLTTHLSLVNLTCYIHITCHIT